LIIHCAEDYSTTIIGMPDRKYIWIMARTAQIDDAAYEALLARARDCGYADMKQIVRVPQEW
jgi:apolipoprotein D and lipocalin family protein